MFFETTSFSMLPDFAALKGYAGTMLVITEIFLNIRKYVTLHTKKQRIHSKDFSYG